MKVQKPPPPHVVEFRRITSIEDPLAALDECSTAIERVNKVFWAKKRTYLGVLAAMYERIRKSEEAWREFIEKPFWRKPKLYGERPTMEDRSDGLRFVVRYGEKAIRRKKSKLAWRHAVVAEYLLDHGVRPIDFAAYLGKRGQGMGKTYEKAQAEKKLAKDGSAAPKTAKPKESAKIVAKDRKDSSGSTWKSRDADKQSAVDATMPEARLIGKRELMEPLLLLSDNAKVPVLLKAVRDEQGRRWYKVVKLLSKGAAGPTTSERRKSKTRRDKPSRHGRKDSSQKRRKAR